MIGAMVRSLKQEILNGSNKQRLFPPHNKPTPAPSQAATTRGSTLLGFSAALAP